MTDSTMPVPGQNYIMIPIEIIKGWLYGEDKTKPSLTDWGMPARYEMNKDITPNIGWLYLGMVGISCYYIGRKFLK